MEYVTLNNGIKMPKLGYGVYQTAPEDTKRCVLDAIETGIQEASIQHRHIKMSQVLVTRWLNVDCRGKNFSLQQKYGLQMQDMKKQKLLLKSL